MNLWFQLVFGNLGFGKLGVNWHCLLFLNPIIWTLRLQFFFKYQEIWTSFFLGKIVYDFGFFIRFDVLDFGIILGPFWCWKL